MNCIFPARFWVKECNAKRCISSLHHCLGCPGSANLGLNNARVIRGSVLQAPAFAPLSGPGHPSPWGCARCTGLENAQSSLQDFQSCRLKTLGPVGSQGLSVWSSFSEKCDSLHLFFIFKRRSYVEAHCGMQTWISLTLRVSAWMCRLSCSSLSPTRLWFVSFLLIPDPLLLPLLQDPRTLCAP